MTSPPQAGNSRGELAVLWGLVLFFMAMSGLWIHLNRGPTRWDDSWYLDDSLKMYDALGEKGVAGWMDQFLNHVQLQFKAPLMCALPTPAYLIFGRDPRAGLLVNLAFIPILLWSVFGIARHFWNARVALFAVFITGTLPQLFGLTTWYLVEYGLAAFSLFAIWCLIKSDDLTRTRWVLLFSFVCGFGMLQKILLPVYIFPIFVYFVVRWIRRPIKLPATIAALVVPILIVAGPWYYRNWHTAIDRAKLSGFSHEEADIYGTGDPFTLPAIGKYGLKLINEGIGASYLVVGLVVLAVLLFTRAKNPHPNPLLHYRERGQETRGWFLLAWGMPFMVFLFGHNKDVRFVAPLLPIFSIGLALGIDRLIRQWRTPSYFVVPLLLAIPLAFLIQLAFEPLGTIVKSIGSDPAHPHDMTSGIHLFGWDLGEVRMYEKYPWPLNAVTNELARLRPTTRDEPFDVMLINDSVHFNCNDLALAARHQKLPMIVTTSAYETDQLQLLKMMNEMEFVLYRENAEPPNVAYNKLFDVALNQLKTSGHFELIRSDINFPDGGTMDIFANLNAPQGPIEGALIPNTFVDSEPCDVQFGSHIRLLNFWSWREGQILHVRYHWQCLALPDQQYRCFVRLRGAGGNDLGNFDHEIIDMKPPMQQWRPGDSAWESFNYDLSTLALSEGIRLQIQFYDPQKKIFLPITIRNAGPHIMNMMQGNIGLRISVAPMAAIP